MLPDHRGVSDGRTVCTIFICSCLMSRILRSLLLAIILIPYASSLFNPELAQNICVLSPEALAGYDASGAIVSTFERCSRNSFIILTEGTFHIERVMVTTGLENVKIDMRGTLLVSVFLLSVSRTSNGNGAVGDGC